MWQVAPGMRPWHDLLPRKSELLQHEAPLGTVTLDSSDPAEAAVTLGPAANASAYGSAAMLFSEPTLIGFSGSSRRKGTHSPASRPRPRGVTSPGTIQPTGWPSGTPSHSAQPSGIPHSGATCQCTPPFTFKGHSMRTYASRQAHIKPCRNSRPHLRLGSCRSTSTLIN